MTSAMAAVSVPSDANGGALKFEVTSEKANILTNSNATAAVFARPVVLVVQSGWCRAR